MLWLAKLLKMVARCNVVVLIALVAVSSHFSISLPADKTQLGLSIATVWRQQMHPEPTIQPQA